jgi:hypothetical protein
LGIGAFGPAEERFVCPKDIDEEQISRRSTLRFMNGFICWPDYRVSLG